MALKSFTLKKSITEKRSLLDQINQKLEKMKTREADIEASISEAVTEEEKATVTEAIEEFENEKTDLESQKAKIEKEIGELEDELKEIEKSVDPHDTKERKGEKKMEIRSSKEYTEAFANYVRTGDDKEVRSLLTENAASGTVPVPEFIEARVRTAWDNEKIMSRVRKTYLRGNIKVGFEISATGAVIHTEGTAAPTEEVLTLGIVTMVPANIKKWITISDEVMDLGSEEFLSYVYDELTYQIAKKAADTIVGKISSAPATSSASAAGQDQITTAPALTTISEAISHLSDEAANPVIIMNKLTYAEFKKIQYAANYAVDPFEGLEVLFNNSLPAYSAASDSAVYAIVGDLGVGAQANFPNGYDIVFKFDDLSLSEKDLVKIVGREYAAFGVVAPKAFTNILKPAAGK